MWRFRHSIQAGNNMNVNEDTIKGQWKQKVGKAKIIWANLTDDELLKIEGQADRLTGLVQERYGISREEAHKQVTSFFDSHEA
jgi:uncharacterized protein YjbJ (UPF0337 family)